MSRVWKRAFGNIQNMKMNENEWKREDEGSSLLAKRTYPSGYAGIAIMSNESPALPDSARSPTGLEPSLASAFLTLVCLQRPRRHCVIKRRRTADFSSPSLNTVDDAQ